jgi:hypothetical protein
MYLIPKSLLIKLISFLAKQPWKDVHELMKQLSQLKEQNLTATNTEQPHQHQIP